MFNKVVIVGVGLLGGSLARDIRQHKLARHVVGVVRSQSTAQYALKEQVIDAVQPLEEALEGADLIVLATPMQVMLPLLASCAHLIPADAIVSDVGSVKTDLYAQLSATQPQLLKQFVLAHPIAGGESSGVSASRRGLFVNKHLIVTNTKEVSIGAVKAVSELWQAVGAKVVAMSLHEHDAIFAKTSHLPHVVAFSLVNYLNAESNRDQLFDLAAAGFYDFTRIASSDAEMWRDICITNKDQVLSALDGYRAQLDEIRENINASDQQGILDYFDSAKSARNAGLFKKSEDQKTAKPA
ncbi:MAG: prephenate dehydrogenase [Dinoroseobacter sp.]|jgi:prephenate dehydrogenase